MRSIRFRQVFLRSPSPAAESFFSAKECCEMPGMVRSAFCSSQQSGLYCKKKLQ